MYPQYKGYENIYIYRYQLQLGDPYGGACLLLLGDSYHYVIGRSYCEEIEDSEIHRSVLSHTPFLITTPCQRLASAD